MNNTLWENAKHDLFLCLAWFGKTRVILISQYLHVSILEGTVVLANPFKSLLVVLR